MSRATPMPRTRRLPWPGAPFAVALGAALLLIQAPACDDEGDTGPGGTAGTTNPGGGAGHGGVGGAGGQPLGGTGGDGGEPLGGAGGQGGAGAEHPCLTAENITAARYGTGTIDAVAGEADYFRFDALGGEPLRISVEPGVASRHWYADPVVTVLSEDGTTVVATDDSFHYYHATAAEFVMRPVADGTFCLKVEHYWSWSGQTPVGAPGFQYDLHVQPYSDLLGAFDVDTEPNDSGAEPQDLVAYEIGPDDAVLFEVVGELDSTTDVDVFRVPVPPWTNAMLVRFDPPGPGGPNVEGTGSTLELDRVDVTDLAGNVYARARPGNTTSFAETFVSPNSQMLLWVVRKAGTPVGDNDFYRLSVQLKAFEDYDLLETEPAAGGNDSLATAEYNPVDQPNNEVGFAESRALGWVDPTAPGDPIDVDYWAFVALAGSQLELQCYAANIGSGIAEATFGVVDDAGQVLQTGVESPATDYEWSDRPPAAAPPLLLPYTGVYFLRVSAAGQLPDVYGRFYGCSLLVFDP